jgi:hypothetical protein
MSRSSKLALVFIGDVTLTDLVCAASLLNKAALRSKNKD